MNSLIKHKHNGYQLHILPDFINGEFLDVCCHDMLHDYDGCQRIPSSDQARIFCFSYHGEQYFHKTFCPRNMLEPIKNFFRGSRAYRSAKGHSLLAKNDFLAPQLVLLGHKKKHNFMVTVAVPNCISLASFLQNMPGWGAPMFWLAKTNQLEQLGKLIGKMHAANIVHGDLLCGNLLLSGEQGKYKIYLIDNERTKHYFILPSKQRLKNLVQLNLFQCSTISKSDRMRFFNHYLSENPAIVPIKKYWIKKVLARTAWRLAKKARKKAPD